MNKIAFCLFGIVGGTGGKDGIGSPVDFVQCGESYKNYIFEGNDVDVFIHSWSEQYGKELNKLYNPKKSEYQFQIKFDDKGDTYSKDRHRSCSRWYSTKKVVNLQRQYAIENKIKYDFIMLSRFDILWLQKLNFNKLKKDIFYVPYWNIHKGHKTFKENASFPDGKMKRWYDLFFIGNQKHIDTLSKIYDNIAIIGNEEYDQHRLVFDTMYPLYKDEFEFEFFRRFDYKLYRDKN